MLVIVNICQRIEYFLKGSCYEFQISAEVYSITWKPTSSILNLPLITAIHDIPQATGDINRFKTENSDIS